MAWSTTQEANEDISEIALAGALAFGLPQSRRYVQRLIAMFDTLAAHPELAPARQAAGRSVRLMPCEAHHILYVVDGADVIVLRVLHHLQDWFELL
ncbi:type II toxin-antitoxin system RelE/ParE family toxin [Devosia sp. YIM 151766]|uniref:type II toxin-antitoxin system RelE/ParE family toxin n=1 Tax=Devosia sp. YIM 151766 TaxID=3017325 RepID=UPI00255CE2B7|nr:type II toxin-antitoxin system RelE/ParE family toxin [Devosia sp. YIM 151766]WIY52196.1 type II toxin-antitoxin system RelE/ParE family toxin [Devosia sp. YIM 151766]